MSRQRTRDGAALLARRAALVKGGGRLGHAGVLHLGLCSATRQAPPLLVPIPSSPLAGGTTAGEGTRRDAPLSPLTPPASPAQYKLLKFLWGAARSHLSRPLCHRLGSAVALPAIPWAPWRCHVWVCSSCDSLKPLVLS